MPAGRGRRAKTFLSHAIILPYMTIKDQSTSQKCKVHFKTSTSSLWRHVADNTHRLQSLLFTYYELPFKKDTLLSLCPREDCGCTGLEDTCLTRHPGREEGREEEGKEEVEEEVEEEELAGKKAQCLWPSGLCQEPL